MPMDFAFKKIDKTFQEILLSIKIIIDEVTDISYNTNYYRILLFLPNSK